MINLKNLWVAFKTATNDLLHLVSELATARFAALNKE